MFVTPVVQRLVLLLGGPCLGACGDEGSDQPNVAQQSSFSIPESVPAVSGQRAPVAAFLMPLRASPHAAEWCGGKLMELVGTEEHLSFLSLQVFHIGEGDEPALDLHQLTVRVQLRSGARQNISLFESLARREVLASVVGYKILESFEGQSLAAGQSFAAIVALKGRFEISEVLAAVARVGDIEIPLTPQSLSADEYERLAADPSRDFVVARLEQPAETAVDEQDER